MRDLWKVHIQPTPDVSPIVATHTSRYEAMRHINALRFQIKRGWTVWLTHTPAGTDTEQAVTAP
ncbi:hypothetical protein H7347_07315 [Corynebacterium sp. zg-331]|uniref:hypothetical protein n=1 Tax=unclassified Corynebacterium TaxID=2624378 RepID=UPI00128BD398|nr:MULTISPECIES: hypothetical protein [unclassified Corynebacterium]MBC3186382.1 hypothetical protein [Corynebacterium sp. zg-331]MPV52869.1 hypothetical protein [Corynebacterium sp. zg331]